MRRGYETRKSKWEKRNARSSTGQSWTFHNRFSACRAQRQLLLGEGRRPLSPKKSNHSAEYPGGRKKHLSRLFITWDCPRLPKASTGIREAIQRVQSQRGLSLCSDILSGRGWCPRLWLTVSCHLCVRLSAVVLVEGLTIDHPLISQDRKNETLKF